MLLRLAVAAGLGGAIGFERELRERQAGLRTHLVVSLGAALFTLVSAYAFRNFGQQGRPDADRSADRQRHRLPRRGRDHPPGLLRARADDGRDALARRRHRDGVRRRLLRRRPHRDARRAVHARPAAHPRVPASSAGTGPSSTGCSSRSRRAAAPLRSSKASSGRAAASSRSRSRRRATAARWRCDVELLQARRRPRSSPASPRSTASSRCGGRSKGDPVLAQRAQGARARAVAPRLDDRAARGGRMARGDRHDVRRERAREGAVRARGARRRPRG